jgi:hypothetical protein
LEAIETSLEEVKKLLSNHRTVIRENEGALDTSSLRSASPVSNGSHYIEEDDRTSQGIPSVVASPAIEKVRAAPINIVRNMKHHILGTNPVNKSTIESQIKDSVVPRLMTQGLNDTLLNR